MTPTRRAHWRWDPPHPDQLDIGFDDAHAIANAGPLLPATLAERLGIEQTADQLIDLGEQPGAALPAASCGTGRFVAELAARVRRAGATGS